MPKSIDLITLEAINNTLTSAGNTWADLIALCTSVAPTPAAAFAAAGAKPETSDVDAAFVHATCEAIISSNCKLTRGGKEFIISLRERASNYPTVRFSPKQWSWFNSIMVDAGVEAIELDGMGNPLDGGSL